MDFSGLSDWSQLSQLRVGKLMSSDLDETGTTVLEMVKCGANLVLDRKVDFSKNFVHRPRGAI